MTFEVGRKWVETELREKKGESQASHREVVATVTDLTMCWKKRKYVGRPAYARLETRAMFPCWHTSTHESIPIVPRLAGSFGGHGVSFLSTPQVAIYCQSTQTISVSACAPVAQLDRASVFGRCHQFWIC